jgi:hypothetical protein
MALFSECRLSCAQIVLDTADIVRDGDFSSTREFKCVTIFDCAQLAAATVPHNEYSAMSVNNSRD